MEDKAEVTTKRGNKVTRDGDEDNPAIIIKAASGSDAIKKVSRLLAVRRADFSHLTSQASEVDGVKP